MNFKNQAYLLSLSFMFLGFTLQNKVDLNTFQSISKPLVPILEDHFPLLETQGFLKNKEPWKTTRLTDQKIKNVPAPKKNSFEKVTTELGIAAFSAQSLNHLSERYLLPNQRIIIRNKPGTLYIVDKEEPLESILKRFEKPNSIPGESLLLTSDVFTFTKEGLLYLQEGSMLWVPDPIKIHIPFLAKPVNWTRISSRFGMRRHPRLRVRRMHDGYDLAAPYGAPVYAGRNGVITYEGWMGGYGNMIEIKHENITTRYGHLSKINVKLGQTVKKKQLIGRVGSTGLSTGPHLHFEVRRNSDGKPLRPNKYLF